VPNGPATLAALALAAVAVPAGGCVVSSDLGGTAFLCSEEPVCPDGYECVEGRCVVPGAGDAGVVDGSIGGDGAVERFAFRQELTVDNASRGELADFPLLVVLDPSRIDYGALRSDGADLELRDDDGGVLAHEVERWDPEGASILWVRVPEVAALSSTSIWLYYGDPSATAVADGTTVWTRYEAVYHLAAEGDELADSTARDYDGTAVGAPSATGFLGLGRSFDGVGQYVDLGSERDFVRAVPGITAEAWINPSAAQLGVVLGVSVGGATTSRVELRRELEETVRGAARTQDVGDRQAAVTSTAVPLDTWSWVVVVCDFAADSVSIYLDGRLETTVTGLLFDGATPDTPSLQAVIGGDEALKANFFAGLIDEVRLAPTALDEDWIAAQHASMRDELVTYGPAEAL
jgi:hypothetical protein